MEVFKEKEESSGIQEEKYERYLEVFFSEFICLQETKLDILLFLTKQSYYSFKRFQENNETQKNLICYSNNYIKKVVDFSEFSEKNIGIITDILIDDTDLSELCLLFENECPKANVIPMICFGNKKEKELTLYKNAKVMHWADPSEVGKLYVTQLLKHEESLLSYCSDSPILTLVNGQSKIRVKKEVFTRICKGNYPWSYEEIIYESIIGINQKLGIFRLTGDILTNKFINIFHYIGVQVKYEQINDEYECVFVPYMMFDTVLSKNQWKNLFDLLYSDTPYWDSLKEPSNNILKQKYYTAIYKAITYYFSIYIGTKFIKFINLDIEMNFINHDDFNSIFNQSIKQLTNANKFSEENYMTTFAFMNQFPESNSRILANRFGTENYMTTFAFANQFPGLNSSVLTCAKENCNDYLSDINELLINLNKDIVGIFMKLYADDYLIESDYRYIENVNLVIFFNGARLYYQAVLEYYKNVGTNYYKYFDLFHAILQDYLKDRGLLNYLITEKEMILLNKIFLDIENKNLEKYLFCRQYLIEDEWYPQDVLMEIHLRKIKKTFMYYEFPNTKKDLF